MLFSERLKSILKEKNITEYRLAKLANMNRSTINTITHGNSEKPNIETIEKIAKALNIPISELLEQPNENEAQELVKQDIIDYEYIATHNIPNEHIFGLKVIDDSMNLVHITENNTVIVKKQEKVENSEIAVVIVGEEYATIKKFFKDGTTVILMPQSSNMKHQPRVIDTKKVPIKVIGKVIQSVVKY